MSNQLAKVSDATKALGVTSSLPANKAITVSELESLISQLPSTAAGILVKLLGDNFSKKIVDDSIMIINSTDTDITFREADSSNLEIVEKRSVKNLFPTNGIGSSDFNGKCLLIRYSYGNWTVSVVSGSFRQTSGAVAIY